MHTGYRGTYVVRWAQTEIDGLVNVPVSAIEVGSAWRWTGSAVRVDDSRDVLVLTNSAEIANTRAHAAARVRRFLGCPQMPVLDDKGGERNLPLFDAGFELTDGRALYEATLVRIDGAQHPLVLFVGRMPPADTDLWVVSRRTADYIAQEADQRSAVICFVPGTLIDTPDGPRPVEDLSEDDAICTRDNGVQKVRWIGARHVTGSRLLAMPELRPVRLRAGFMGQGQPPHDLIVSPDHRVLIKGQVAQALFNTSEVLVAARDLINDATVRVDHHHKQLTYIHLMLDSHQIVWANGVQCETFHPAATELAQMDPAQLAGLAERFPDVPRDPLAYGDFARRVLSRAEAALLSYGAFPAH